MSPVPVLLTKTRVSLYINAIHDQLNDVAQGSTWVSHKHNSSWYIVVNHCITIQSFHIKFYNGAYIL